MAHTLLPHRPAVYVRQGPAPPFSRSKPVTRDDIQDLKRLRLCLLDEKRQLLTRIARAEVQNRRSAAHSRSIEGQEGPRGNERLYRELDREHQALHHLILKQKRQIARLSASDDAGSSRRTRRSFSRRGCASRTTGKSAAAHSRRRSATLSSC
jgi:hypothetical protein